MDVGKCMRCTQIVRQQEPKQHWHKRMMDQLCSQIDYVIQTEVVHISCVFALVSLLMLVLHLVAIDYLTHISFNS
jgi:hypothetical protein